MRTEAFHQVEKAGLLEQLNEEREGYDEATLQQVWKSSHRANGPSCHTTFGPAT
jgi:hypothetical protein